MNERVKIREHRFSRQPAKRTHTDKIIIHNTDSEDVPASTIHEWHLERGWFGIGYHFVIRANGDIETGRRMNEIGAHARGENENSIGIALTGRFEEHSPTQEQIESLVWLIRELRGKYGNLQIMRHADVSNTLCPGSLFPWDELQNKLREEPPDVGKYFKDVPDGHWAADRINKAYELGLVTGRSENKFKPDEPPTRAEVIVFLMRLYELEVK